MHLNSKIITIGNTKGGSGKSTFAVLLTQYLSLKIKWKASKGFPLERIAIIDLDAPQWTTNTFFGNRKKNFGEGSVIPYVVNYDISKLIYPYENFLEFLQLLKQTYNYIIIDSGGHHDHITKLAISLADILITPVINTLIDFNVLFTYHQANNEIVEGSYTSFVKIAKNKHKKLSWFVIPNRCSPIVHEYSKKCLHILQAMSDLIGFRVTSHILDRSLYSQGFDLGLTCYDEGSMNLYFYNSSSALLNAQKEISLVVDNILDI